MSHDFDSFDSEDIENMLGGYNGVDNVDNVDNDNINRLINKNGTLNKEYINDQAKKLGEIFKKMGEGKDVWKYFESTTQRKGKKITFADKSGLINSDGTPHSDTSEKKRAINDILTSLAVNNMVTDEIKRKIIIAFTIDFFNNVLQTYCEIVGINKNKLAFIYKGGNVLRLIFLDAMYEVPKHIANDIIKELISYFKISDNDYECKMALDIHEGTGMTYDEVFRNLTAISHMVLLVIRRTISSNKNFFALYDYYAKNYDAKKQVIDLEIDNIKKQIKDAYNGDLVSITHGRGICNDNMKETTCDGLSDIFYANQSDQNNPNLPKQKETKVNDIVVLNDGNEPNINVNNNKVYALDQMGMPTNSNNEKASPLRVSTNTGITIEKFNPNTEKKTNLRFNLVRTKWVFEAEVIINMIKTQMMFTAEHIDVSLQYMAGLYLDTYKIYNYDGVEYLSYNYDYYIYDLFRILFEEVAYPWDDLKYLKRLYRIIFLYCFWFKYNKIPLSIIIETLSKLQVYILKLQNTLPNNTKEIYEQLLNYIDNLSSKIKLEIKIKEFFVIMSIITGKITDIKDVEEYKKFWKNTTDIITIMNDMFKKLLGEIKNDVTCDDKKKYIV